MPNNNNNQVADPRALVFTGIAVTTAAYFLFTLHDAAVKWLVASFAVWQILFVRSLTILAGCLAFGGRGLIRKTLRSPVVKPMFLRSFLLAAAWFCFYTAARELQLAELTTIYFAAPIIVTVLAIVVLGEQVSLVGWIAVLTGFAGVFIACDPANLGLSWPVALVLFAAFAWALAIVLLRKIALHEQSLVQMTLNNSFFLVITIVPLALVWRRPDLGDLLMLIGVGVIGGGAQFLLIEGMKRAPASVLAPFEYTALVWAFALGYLIWSDVPRSGVVYGATLIIAAGLMVIVGERLRRYPAKV
jgi:drug/metabolite transporter (DMT)-like permease